MLLLAPAAASPATERSHAERSFAIEAGGKVVLDLAFHTVEVAVRPGPTVEVTVDLEVTGPAAVAKKLIEDYEPRFAEKKGQVVVRSIRRRSGTEGGSVRLRGRVVVAMPPGVQLAIDTTSGHSTLAGDFGNVEVRCSSSSGGMSLRGAAREVHAEVSSGEVTIGLARVANLVRVSSSSGRVLVAGPCAVIQVDSSSGDVVLRDLVGHVIADTSSGGLDASWARPPRGIKVRVDANSGGVRLRFPEGTEVSGRVTTSSGKIRSDFPGRVLDDGDELRLTGAAGGVRVAVDTSSGGVRLIRG